jgi:thymidylate synthase ThyX
MSSEIWSGTEQSRLAPFFTNLDRDVFGLRLPQEVAGALFSRYSRTTKSLRRVFLNEFAGREGLPLSDSSAVEDAAAIKKAREFYDRVLVGYGDDSVAQLGGAHIACEEVSNVAAKLLEDSRVGMAPLEKSTRYVRFDQKDANGQYLFFREPRLVASRHGRAYLDLMTLLFDTYGRQMEPVMGWIRRRLPVEDAEFKHPQTGEPLSYAQAEKDPDLRQWVETAYRSTVRAQACDLLRGLLPAATRTNVGLFGSGQAFEHLLNRLYSHELTEAKGLAEAIHRELGLLIPSFVKRARPNPYLIETRRAVGSFARELLQGTMAESEAGPAVRLIRYDRDAEDRLLTAILFPQAAHSMSAIQKQVQVLSPDRRQRLLEEYLKRRRHRRDKPGRALENVTYTFEIVCNLGSYRDLHRHRLLTQERQDFTVAHGYDTPQELVEMGIGPEFERCMASAAEVYHAVAPEFPVEAQYVVPFAYRVRWYVTLNLREAVHVVELRSMPQGHPDYRWVAHEIWRQIQSVHPALSGCAAFIDRRDYRLGRLQSELRTEYKKSLLQED